MTYRVSKRTMAKYSKNWWTRAPGYAYGQIFLTLSEQKYLVWDTASRSTKRQDMLEIWGCMQRRNEGWQGGHNPPGAEWPRGAPKSPNNAASTFFSTLHLLP